MPKVEPVDGRLSLTRRINKRRDDIGYNGGYLPRELPNSLANLDLQR